MEKNILNNIYKYLKYIYMYNGVTLLYRVNNIVIQLLLQLK